MQPTHTAGPTTEPLQSSCGREYFQLHILNLQAPSFGLRHGRKCEICPTLTLSFLTRPRAAHKAKPSSERGIPEGLKASCRPPFRTGETCFPRCLLETGKAVSGHVNIYPVHAGDTKESTDPKLQKSQTICTIIIYCQEVLVLRIRSHFLLDITVTTKFITVKDNNNLQLIYF